MPFKKKMLLEVSLPLWNEALAFDRKYNPHLLGQDGVNEDEAIGR